MSVTVSSEHQKTHFFLARPALQNVPFIEQQSKVIQKVTSSLSVGEEISRMQYLLTFLFNINT